VRAKIEMHLLLTGRLKLVQEFLASPDFGIACADAGCESLLTALLESVAGLVTLLT
jgi:hypothetical protein